MGRFDRHYNPVVHAVAQPRLFDAYFVGDRRNRAYVHSKRTRRGSNTNRDFRGVLRRGVVLL